MVALRLEKKLLIVDVQKFEKSEDLPETNDSSLLSELYLENLCIDSFL